MVQDKPIIKSKNSAPPVLTPVILLDSPQLGENIGMVARAMANFGLSELRLIAPRDGWPNPAALAAASGADEIIENARVFDSIEPAIADLHFIAASTARPRDMVKPVLDFSQTARHIRQRTWNGQKCGLLFGREASGLGNDQIALCDLIATAPVNPEFASLNLAQSVLLLAYEYYQAASPDMMESTDGPKHYTGRHKSLPSSSAGPVMTNSTTTGRPVTRPATRAELIGLFDHFEQALTSSGYLRPPEKKATMMRNIKNIIHRMAASEQDVKTLRGILASLTRKIPPG